MYFGVHGKRGNIQKELVGHDLRSSSSPLVFQQRTLGGFDGAWVSQLEGVRATYNSGGRGARIGHWELKVAG